MTKALIERFLGLLATRIREAYQTSVLLAQPNATFIDVFRWFVDNYAYSTELDRTENRNRMLKDWHPNDGFDSLVNQIREGVLFASYADHELSDADIVDIATQVAMKSGIFNDAYKEWHRQPAADKTWANWQNFWRAEFKAAIDVSKAAGQFGFGNAATANQQADAEFDNSVAQFAEAHSATQTTISGLTATNQQLAAQNQQLQVALAARQQQLMYAAPAQPFQWQQQQNNGGGGGGGGRGRRNNRRNRNNGGWNPTGGLQQQQQQQSQDQSTWPRLLATGQPVDPKNIKQFNNDNYCWTHGHNLSDGHTSATCTRRHPSGLHNPMATKANTMGGNPKGANMVRPDQCGLQPGWKQARRQGANAAWAPAAPAQGQLAVQPAAAPAAPLAAPAPFMAPAPAMMAPTWPMSMPMMQPPAMQQQSANMMMNGGVPQYCWPAATGGMRMM